MDDLEYIVKGALMMCDQSDTPMYFGPTYAQTTNTKIQGLYIATVDDATPITHIPSFLLCKKTDKPCKPKTTPGSWKDPWPIKIKDKQALIGRCTCPCSEGGVIEFITSGQIPLDDETKKEIEEMQEDGQRELDDKGYGNSVGESGFVEGMIPIWGSGKDMVNDLQTGDSLGAVVNGVFLFWDAASVVAGIFSLGSGTVAMQGAKGGAKTTVKNFGKEILSGAKGAGKWIKGLFTSSADDIAEVAVKKTLKETAKGGAKALKEALKKKIDDIAKKLGKSCVFACFPAGTKIYTGNGFRNIEDIRIGDKVWSCNEEAGEIALQEVLSLVVSTSDHIVKINIGDEVIETTAIHLFYTNKGWKEAGCLAVGDCIQSMSSELVEIKNIEFDYSYRKVYNFEVAVWHTYFISTLILLVHNGKCAALFPDVKKLAKEFGTTVDDFHRNIKPAILKDASEWMKKIGTTNPDIGFNSGVIILKNPKTGTNITTDLLMNWYKN